MMEFVQHEGALLLLLCNRANNQCSCAFLQYVHFQEYTPARTRLPNFRGRCCGCVVAVGGGDFGVGVVVNAVGDVDFVVVLAFLMRVHP